ncbi:MAG: YebC/PmpR family DNA-binding transcriptional regulator [Oscillospiraceae bacterium]|jgi:YebC/PmpR family DNA-binding regulatory protein|nr:YebC/PmpR family DNA-binding transcriptional regulator [Oscillospiraceae bacterium]
MSGHSKWHNIQRTKNAADAKRGQTFTKIAREIMVSVKEGGSGDPAGNSRLAAAVAKAKAANMPNDNIKRTIEKALGAGAGDSYESVVYEGYGPAGIAVIVEAMTDNRNRTASDVRHAFDKYGGKLGAAGCVAWSFNRRGVIVVDNEDGGVDEERMLADALEAGALDVEADGAVFELYTEPDGVAAAAGALEELGYRLLSAQAEMVPQSRVGLTDAEDIKNMEKMLELLEDNDDVQNVWHNREE